MMEDRLVLQTADYVVIVVMLLIPLAIGVFFAIRDAKKSTRDEYLLGGRRMAMLPVALSLFVSYQSAIAVIGFPVEVYLHGPMVFPMYIGVAFIYVLSYYTFVPLFHPLQLTSIYEYAEMRFESKAVRMLATVMGIIQNLFYMTIAMLAPGLALEAAAGIPLWVSVVIVGATGTIYTAVGGIKSVIWSDVFQTIITLVGVYGVMIISTYRVGGTQNVFEINQAGGRINFDSISIDPRVRHTWWNTIGGGTFMWLSQILNQAWQQRISSLKTLRDARRTMIMNVPISLIFGATMMLTGWCMYAYLHHIRCDPVQAGLLTNYNQVAPFYVIHSLHGIPGMAGLYMSALFSAALSTLSSGINAMAANTVEDILQKPMKSLSEKTVTTVIKIVALFYGAAIIGLAYAAKSLQGPVTQMATTVAGLFGGCNVGIILLGCTVPWTNKYGVVSGAVGSLAINLWLGVGARLYGQPAPSLVPVPSDQCFNSTMEENTYIIETYRNVTKYNFTNASTIAVDASDQLPDEFSPYDISYQLYSLVGIVSCYVVGLVVSRITRRNAKTQTDPKLILGCLRRFWGMNQQSDVADYELDIDHSKNYNLRDM